MWRILSLSSKKEINNKTSCIVEYVQEYAKNLVWTKDFDTLNNQYYVTSQQDKLFSQMNGHVDFIVTDGTILHGLYYKQIS